MSTYDDMARDAGYIGDTAAQVARTLEEQHRDEVELEMTRCTHCAGAGLCWDGADPLGDCPDESHRCHACGGSGAGKDQVIF